MKKPKPKQQPQPPAPPFKVGDWVTTDYYERDTAVPRCVVKVYHEPGGRWYVTADTGEQCAGCGRRAAPLPNRLDSAWFTIAEGKVKP